MEKIISKDVGLSTTHPKEKRVNFTLKFISLFLFAWLFGIGQANAAFSNVSDEYSISEGQSFHADFINVTPGSYNYQNFLLWVTLDNSREMVLRADSWWFCGEYNPNNTLTNVQKWETSGYNWDTFLTSMNNASVEADVSFAGGKVYMTLVITGSDGTIMYEKMVFALDDTDITAKVQIKKEDCTVTMENAYVANTLTYDFTSSDFTSLTFSDVSFTTSLESGYRDGKAAEKMTMYVANEFNNRFAFCTTGNYWKKSPVLDTYYYGNYDGGIVNRALSNNIFSVLNLRAGDIVTVYMKTTSSIAENLWYVKSLVPDQMIVANSNNANATNLTDYKYLGYGKSNNAQTDAYGALEQEYRYVMLEDGNLDLKAACYSTILSISITSPYSVFGKGRTHVADGSFTTPAIAACWAEPVVQYYGDLDGSKATVTVNSDNTVTVSGFTGKNYTNGYWEGGTIVVMSGNTMYSYTVPYEVEKQQGNFSRWNFWMNELGVGRSTDPVYESLQAHDIMFDNFNYYNTVTNGTAQYLSLYQNVMDGQNAYFNHETAGLIFETPDTEQYGYLNETTTDVSDGDRWMTLRSNGKMIIPELKAGNQVWVYIDSYGNPSLDGTTYNSSISFKVTNATDALGKDIDSTTPIVTGGSVWGPSMDKTNSGKWPSQYYAALHFYAKADGDMEFTFYPNENRLYYAKIAYVKILKADPQGIIEPTNGLLTFDNKGYEILATQDAAGTYTNTSAAFGLHESQGGSKIQRYEVLETSGTLDKDYLNSQISANTSATTTGIGTYIAAGYENNNSVKFRYTSETYTDNGVERPHFGSFLIRGKDYDHTGTYCLDYADRVLAVGFRQTMNYPYTWNLKDILASDKGNSASEFAAAASRTDVDSTKIWTSDNGVYSLQNNYCSTINNRVLCSGTQLYANDTYIEEAAGLGWATINMNENYNGSIQVTENGVKVQTFNGWEHRLFIPGANKDGRIYVRGKKINGGAGFVAKAYKNASLGPNTMNAIIRSTGKDPRVELTRIETDDATEATSTINYDGNMANLFDASSTLEADFVDGIMTIKATSEKPVSVKTGSSRSVDNSIGLFTTKDVVYETGTDEEGGTYVISDNHVYQNNDGVTAIYDYNVSLNDEITDEFTTCIDLKGEQKTAARFVQIDIPSTAGTCNVTVVARSNSPRQLIVKGDGSEIATMITYDQLMAKTFSTDANTITIGSKNSGIEIYSVIVEEKANTSGSGTETYIGYVDVASTDGGVTLYLNDIIIEKIGYSTDVKTLNSIGWASESRDHYIDHSLTEEFTDDPVKAYMATGTAIGDNNLINAVSLTQLTLPMELSTGNGSPSDTKKTGCILYNSDKTAVEGGVYLFVPAIHDYLQDSYITNANFKGDVCTNGSAISTGTQSSDNADATKINMMDGNMMIANLYGDIVKYSGTSAEYINYVLSSTYTDPNGVTHPTADEEAEERFVRVGTSGATGKLNTAYLQLPLASVKPEGYTGSSNLIIIFDEDNQGGEADGIENIDFSSNGTIGNSSGNDSFYTITGQKVDNITKPGIYVKNGKKVLVK